MAREEFNEVMDRLEEEMREHERTKAELRASRETVFALHDELKRFKEEMMQKEEGGR